jgi:4'-phosphopantetheinyl transferase
MAEITSSAVRLFAADLDKWMAADRSLLLAALSEQDLEVARRRSDHAASRYVASHSFLRIALGQILQSEPRSVPLTRLPCLRCRQAHGRPVVAGGPEFSFSHSRTRAVVAVRERGVIGVDVEERREIADALGIARHVAQEEEIQRLRSEEDQSDAFLRLWVGKEAVVKATGQGISGARSFSLVKGPPDGWSVDVFELDARHVMGVAGPLVAPTENTQAGLAVDQPEWLVPPRVSRTDGGSRSDGCVD